MISLQLYVIKFYKCAYIAMQLIVTHVILADAQQQETHADTVR